MFNLIFQASLETLYMVFTASSIALVFGLPLGVVLAFGDTLLQSPKSKTIISALSNALRSIPFIILIIALIPITRLIVGTAIGTTAAIVPLSIGAIPFFARLVENALLELPKGIIEAGLSMGASPKQIIQKMVLPEAFPGLINSFTVTVITLIAYSAMAGAVGAGGLGDLAIRYGYQRFDMNMTYATVIVLIVLVQLLQFIGDKLAKYFSHL